MVICQYCNNAAILVDGEKIYPHRPDLKHLNFWYCDNGHEPAYVGCHSISTKHKFTGTEPKGTLANSVLRSKRSLAHSMFDPLWKKGDRQYFTSRSAAYNWLASSMNLTSDECHIGMFNESQCDKVISLLSERA